MQIGNRFRCYPSPIQEKMLLQWIGCQRFIYNAKVQEDRYFRTFARKSLQHTGQFAPIDQQYSQFKHPELTPWLFERRQARRMQGSRRWKRAKQRVAQCQQYATALRRDFCHQTSHALVADPAYKLYVLEALKVKNTTASAKGDTEKPSKNVQQKAGLNPAILASGWGQIKVYTQYKALRAGKLCIEVPAHYSSQECSHCGFTHPDNRRSQAEFVCQSCHYTDNADTNAAKVLVKRGVALILGEGVAQKKVQRARVRKQKVGAECSKPAGAT